VTQQEDASTDTSSLSYMTIFAADPFIWVALANPIAMEMVLGIDNLIFTIRRRQ
jgi:predicted tellurium resistance membrane protein TerC